MKNSIELIKRLSLAFGPSGMEDEVRKIIYEEISPYAKDIRRDALGNLIAHLPSDKEGAPTLMLSAHMDEVGFMISHIEDSGMLRFAEVGGMDESVLAGRRVTLLGHDERKINGVIASKPIHLQSKDERERAVPMDKLYIDVGANSKEDAERMVEIGDCGVFCSELVRFGDGGNRIKCKALDDRMGCAILIEVLRRVVSEAISPDCNLAFAFTTREETGLSGATVAANSINPDYAIILETTAVADLPDVEEKNQVAHLGEGGALSILDRSTVYERDFLSFALSYKNEIPMQIKQYVSGGNDAAHIKKTADGCRVLALSAPTRYLHSASCVLDIRDCDAMEELVYRIIRDFKMLEGRTKR